MALAPVPVVPKHMCDFMHMQGGARRLLARSMKAADAVKAGDVAASASKAVKDAAEFGKEKASKAANDAKEFGKETLADIGASVQEAAAAGESMYMVRLLRLLLASASQLHC